jgi:hypothetical protein
MSATPSARAALANSWSEVDRGSFFAESQIEVRNVVGGKIVLPGQRFQGNVPEPFCAQYPDQKGREKLNVFVSIGRADPLALTVSDKNTIRYSESPYFRHNGIGFDKMFQDGAAVGRVLATFRCKIDF